MRLHLQSNKHDLVMVAQIIGWLTPSGVNIRLPQHCCTGILGIYQNLIYADPA